MVIRINRTIPIMGIMVAMVISLFTFFVLTTSNPVYIPKNIVYDMPPLDTTGCTWDGSNWTNPLGKVWNGNSWVNP
jgi:hypothetical protein